MLVIISDIHFSDGTAGEHNLPYSAFESILLSDIVSLAEDKGAKEIKILLLGDIVDLIRSEQWFELNLADRPWGSKGLSDIPNPRKNSLTEKQALKILGHVDDNKLKDPTQPESLPEYTVLHKNWKTFKLFREFKEHLNEKTEKDVQVEIIYVPGNHDRLINLYPSLRSKLQKILGITVNKTTVEGDPNGEWKYRYDFKDESYGLYARHGHQYDTYNYGIDNDFTYTGHIQTPIGDVFTTEFAVKIPWQLAQLRKANPKKYSQITDDFIEKTKDIDNVRPLSQVLEWIYYKIKKEDSGQIRKALDEAFDKIVKELLEIELVQKWRSPKTHWDEAIRIISSRWLKWIPKTLLDKIDAEDLLPLFLGMIGGRDDIFINAAYQERIWKEKKEINFILYGHTHSPLQRPLDSVGDREVLYINTGTWRNRIYKTVELDKAPDFIELKQMTYSIFYRKDEDKRRKKKDTMSFDTWTGSKKKFYT
jgi:UDP-2,3-diacylglucosamine pyrophosphatase LpxH